MEPINNSNKGIDFTKFYYKKLIFVSQDAEARFRDQFLCVSQKKYGFEFSIQF